MNSKGGTRISKEQIFLKGMKYLSNSMQFSILTMPGYSGSTSGNSIKITRIFVSTRSRTPLQDSNDQKVFLSVSKEFNMSSSRKVIANFC